MLLVLGSARVPACNFPTSRSEPCSAGRRTPHAGRICSPALLADCDNRERDVNLAGLERHPGKSKTRRLCCLSNRMSGSTSRCETPRDRCKSHLHLTGSSTIRTSNKSNEANMKIVKSLLLLCACIFPLSGNSLADPERATVLIDNPMNKTIHYQLEWGPEGQWKNSALAPGL